MGHGPDHGAVGRAGARHAAALKWSFGLVAAYFVVEVFAGFLTNSLALLSDAGHMFTDVIGLGMALAAIRLASKAVENPQRTFGLYRLEILAALANGLLLFGVAFYVLFEAYRRLREPPEILGLPMLVVGGLGLAVNLISFGLLRRGARESLNVEGAYLEVLSDAIGSGGVLVAAAVYQTTGWPYIDPLVGAGIGLWILPRTYRLVRQGLRIIMQAAPPHIDVETLQLDLASIGGVEDVHDCHLWTLTSGMDVATAHLRVSQHADTQEVLQEARVLLKERYEVAHATLQIEGDEECEGCSW